MEILSLLLLLDLTSFSQALDFWTSHVDNPKTRISGSSHHYCNVMMKQRGLITRSHCMPVNTFIHETNSTLINICATPSVSCGRLSLERCNKSSQSLKVTYCYTKSFARPPDCGYRAKIDFAIIGVICVEGQPAYLLQP
ncbi:ribonuclease pancreatic A-like [Macrotis lagotis]|uniref:ribonuclease pancreatic A-like n=1 Tax=Macrotis lagotis TaxID=92651 RepID=UPI003D69A35E